MTAYQFIDNKGAICAVHFGGRYGISHPGCEYRAEVYPDLDSFFCRECSYNGRISGAWFMDLLDIEEPKPSCVNGCEGPFAVRCSVCNSERKAAELRTIRADEYGGEP